jgi:predicted HicB family RNase H-like nuclease
MRRKVKKFQMRMHPDDHRRLMQLADKDRIGMAEWLQNHIRSEAKRKGLK